jgi:SAM-dependent methyltransferase
MPRRLSFDRVATVYDETRALSPRAMSRVLGVLVEELRGKRVLEVGVGTGRYAVPLQKSGIRVVGVDISRHMVNLGLAKGLRDIVFADGARLPFVARAFDVATTNHVLHLISNWVDVLEEIARVTRDSFFSVIEHSENPSIHSEYNALVRESGFQWRHPGIHERDLPGLLKPDIVIPVGPFRETVSMDTMLKPLAERAFSNQWEVPEDIHREAIQRLRKKWAGKEYDRSYSLEIAFWRVERIPELAKAAAQRS